MSKHLGIEEVLTPDFDRYWGGVCGGQRAPYYHVAFAATRRGPPVTAPPLVGRPTPLPVIRFLGDVQPERIRQCVEFPEGVVMRGAFVSPSPEARAIPRRRRTPTRRASEV